MLENEWWDDGIVCSDGRRVVGSFFCVERIFAQSRGIEGTEGILLLETEMFALAGRVASEDVVTWRKKCVQENGVVCWLRALFARSAKIVCMYLTAVRVDRAVQSVVEIGSIKPIDVA